MPRFFGQADLTSTSFLPCYWEGELLGIREQEKNLHFTPHSILPAYTASLLPLLSLSICVIRVRYLHKIIDHRWISARFQSRHKVF